MTDRGIARRYAQALLQVMRAEGDPAAAERDLQSASRVVQGHDDLRRVLLNPAVPVTRKRAVMEALLAHAPDLTSPVAKLLVLLAERDRIGVLPELVAAYGEALLAHQDVVRALVTTAVPLSVERTQALERGLSEVTGKRVTVEASVDPAILGGVVTRIGSLVYDGSVTRQLERLRTELVEG